VTQGWRFFLQKEVVDGDVRLRLNDARKSAVRRKTMMICGAGG